MPSYSIVWHLLHVVYDILNMQRYATAVAGQTCSYSDNKAAKGGRYGHPRHEHGVHLTGQ